MAFTIRELKRAFTLRRLVSQLVELGHVERAQILISLAPHMPEELLAKELKVARAIKDTDNRTRALEKLAPRLAELSRTNLYFLWQESLPVLASRTRRDVLADLRALTPVIASLGGEEAIEEIFHAIQDVGRWWP